MVGSDILENELLRISNFDKLKKVMDLYSLRGPRIVLNDQILDRSEEFQRLGLKLFDSLHLALAESFDENVVLLTTDDFFIKVAAKTDVKIPVKNPAIWLMEGI
jgi:predicted nucleic acid-binding protein